MIFLHNDIGVGRWSARLGALGCGLLLACSAQAQSPEIGRVLLAVGQVERIRAEQSQPAPRGTTLINTDQLRVGERSSAQLRLIDQTMIALRSNTELHLSDFVFEESVTDRSSLTLIQGGLRTITGLVGRAQPQNYRLQTPTATVGIRGTQFAVVHCNNDCTDESGSPQPNGTYGLIGDGRVVIQTSAGEREFLAQEVFYVAAPDELPVRLMEPPAFLADRSFAEATQRQAEQEQGAAASAMASRAVPLALQRSSVPQLSTMAPVQAVAQLESEDFAANVTDRLPTQQPSAPTVSLAGFFVNTLGADVSQATTFVNEFVNQQAEGATSPQEFAQTLSGLSGSFTSQLLPLAEAGPYAFVLDFSNPQNGVDRFAMVFGQAQALPLPTSGLAQFSFLGAAPVLSPGVGSGPLEAQFSAGRLQIDFTAQTLTVLDPVQIATLAGPALTLTLPAESVFAPGALDVIRIGSCAGCDTGVSVWRLDSDLGPERFLGPDTRGYLGLFYGAGLRDAQVVDFSAAGVWVR